MCSGCSGNYSGDYEESSERMANDVPSSEQPWEKTGVDGRAERVPMSSVQMGTGGWQGWAVGCAARQVTSPEDDDWEIMVSASEIIEVRRLRAITPFDLGGDGKPA